MAPPASMFRRPRLRLVRDARDGESQPRVGWRVKKVLTIHLVRHGETEASLQHRFCGVTECALTERGRRQAEAVVERCAAEGDWRAVYTSPSGRCRMLADAVGERVGVAVTVADGLHEIDHGAWDGRSEAQIEAEEPQAYAAYTRHPDFFGAPGGEIGYQVAARAMPVIQHIIETHDDGDVLVVSHKGTIRIVACALLGIGIGLYRARIAQPVASFTVFEMGPDGPLLRRLGDVAHLALDLRVGTGV
jgi:broad specificity phosphatase PhoE